MAATAVGGGMVLLNKSSETRSVATLDTNQNNTIENIILDMRTILANSESCKASMENSAGEFQQIGDYKADLTKAIENHVYLSEITSITDPNDPSITARSPKYKVVFIKKNPSKNSERTKAEFLRVQKFNVAQASGADVETCSSYEVAGVDNTIQSFCSSIGAEFDFDSGKCDVDSIDPTQYTESLGQESCSALGGTFIMDDAANKVGHCSKINLPSAQLTTSHFKLNSVALTGKGSKTGFQTVACSGVEVSNGVTTDGGVTCAAIVCPNVNTNTDGSSYAPAEGGVGIECQCSRDRGSELACGTNDVNSCAVYEVADGCGTGRLCNINRGKPTTGICANGDKAGDMYTDQYCWDENGCRDAKDRIRGTMCRPDYSCASSTDVGDTCSDGCGGKVDGISALPVTSGGTCSNGSFKFGDSTIANGLCCMEKNSSTGFCTEPGHSILTCVDGSWVTTCYQIPPMKCTKADCSGG
jgi:hypothetical protein